jgi:alkyl sulfatase BDS1-like metallo-beta-lactamase superfamily hydrolase
MKGLLKKYFSHMSPHEEAEKITAIAGDQATLLDIARQSLVNGEAQWAAQLYDYLLALNKNTSEAKLVKADALTVLARASVNALARNYYLMEAQRLRMQVRETDVWVRSTTTPEWFRECFKF